MTDFVLQAEQQAASARTTLGEVIREVEAATERFEEARNSLRSALGAQLIDRNDPAIAKRLTDAQTVEREASRAVDLANLTLEAARQNVKETEEAYTVALRRRASDTIQARTAELLTIAQEADAALTKYVELTKKGHALDMAITQAARITLQATLSTKWRSVSATRAKEIVNATANGTDDWTGPTGYASALSTAAYIQSQPLYEPTNPDAKEVE